MEAWFKNIRIKNFKSIREATLNDCAKINLLVGKPNVGKSNILEAVGLLNPIYLKRPHARFGEAIVRYEWMPDLFYDQNSLNNQIEIGADSRTELKISSNNGSFLYELSLSGMGLSTIKIAKNGIVEDNSISADQGTSTVKKYHFPDSQVLSPDAQELSLNSPHGENLITILQTNRAYRLEAGQVFEDYGLELLVDSQTSRLEIAKRRDGVLFKTPFSLVADTLRRYLFHLAAVVSNQHAILLFEEPESHNYPPYIQLLAHRIMEEKTNQYFITTHSPFLFNTLIENAKDVAVFVVEYEDFETKVRRLSDDNLREILDYGLNIFTEQELFT